MTTKTINKNDLITQRPYRPGDRNFILATWLRGLYYGDTWFSGIQKSIFMENYHKILESAMSKLTITIACLKDDPDVIVGYSVFHATPSQLVLDWVFVKSAWRNIGVAKDLVPVQTEVYTHTTKVGNAILQTKLKHLTYNPFLF